MNVNDFEESCGKDMPVKNRINGDFLRNRVAKTDHPGCCALVSLVKLLLLFLIVKFVNINISTTIASFSSSSVNDRV